MENQISASHSEIEQKIAKFVQDQDSKVKEFLIGFDQVAVEFQQRPNLESARERSVLQTT